MDLMKNRPFILSNFLPLSWFSKLPSFLSFFLSFFLSLVFLFLVVCCPTLFKFTFLLLLAVVSMSMRRRSIFFARGQPPSREMTPPPPSPISFPLVPCGPSYKTRDSHLLCKGKFHSTAHLQFVCFGFSCIAT